MVLITVKVGRGGSNVWENSEVSPAALKRIVREEKPVCAKHIVNVDEPEVNVTKFAAST